MSTDYAFEGWLGKDKSAAEGNMTWGEYRPKRFEETDVDIKVSESSCMWIVMAHGRPRSSAVASAGATFIP